MLILTATALFLNYCKLHESHAAVSVYYEVLGDVGMKAFLDYGNKWEFIEVTTNLCIRLYDLDMSKEFLEMFKVTKQFHPRRPSYKSLCEMLSLEEEFDPDALSVFQDQDFKKACARRAAKRGIPREFTDQLMEELSFRLGRISSMGDFIEMNDKMNPQDIKF